MCSKLPRHHCLLSPHVAEDCTVFFFFKLLLVPIALVCLRCSLLDVSRLLGLTLRPSAPVCCCHQDSLTRWRLVLAQEAARVASSSSREFWQLVRNFSSRVADVWCPVFSRRFCYSHIVLFICCQQCTSLSVVEHEIG